MGPDPGWTSILPPLIAVALAFATRDAILSLALACVAGLLLMGQGLEGVSALITRALGKPDFVWIVCIELFIGVLVAFLQRSGAIAAFQARASRRVRTRRQVGLLGWGLGLFIFFSDYLSPLFVGAVMRDLTDRVRISREKLAYICDSTSAPVSVLVPFSAWGAYQAGLCLNALRLPDPAAGLALVVRSLPYNFYAILTVLLVGAIAAGLLPDFGPMRAAERRARETGKLLRDGAVPMMGRELTELAAADPARASLLLHFALPVALVVAINLGGFALAGSAPVLGALMTAVSVLGLTLWAQRVDRIAGLMQTALAGMKGVMPAVVILALAYCINTLTQEMKTASWVVGVTQDWMAPALVPLLAFGASAVISFATGTSWGTFAIMLPIALPLAQQLEGGTSGPLVLASLGAVAGGGVFGDHCSPLSDTTVLSSLGSACDHIDHTRTQLPYALAAGAAAGALHAALGWAVAP